MDKKLIAALSGASALALLSGAAGAAPQVDHLNRLEPARSYGDLLEPIPNAKEILKAEDSRAAEPEAKVELAQFYYHHHHHHHFRRDFYHHHHHHHFYPRFYREYHHHHHHHWRRRDYDY